MNLQVSCGIGVLAFGASLGAQPVLKVMQPRGAQAGSAVRLALSGEHLGPAPRLISEAQLVATPLVPPVHAQEDARESLAYLLEVDPGAQPGVYPLRLETAEGLSNALLFTVGEFPQALERESDPSASAEDSANDFPETAQPIAAPVALEGRLDGAERDLFRFRGRTGQKLVAEVAARRIGSAIDPHLELLNSKGLAIARNGDAPGLGLDARLAFEVPEDGDYFLAVWDARFSAQDQNFYRLTLASYLFADRVFPLGWSRDGRVEAELSGGNLPEPLRREVDLSGAPANASEMWLDAPESPASVRFLLSDGEEALEADSGGRLRDGVVLNGRIERPGEVDLYRLAVQGGEEWAFELRSGELPGSSLYGVMTISAGDGALAVAGKHAGDPNPYVISTTGQTATYPFVNLTVPPGESELSVAVEDLLGRGGPAYSYRLVARKQGPDFLLSLNEPYVNIPADGSAVVNVTAERRGYHGPIQLYVANAPDDLEVSGGHIAPTSTLGNRLPRFAKGQLTLTSKPGSPARLLDLVVRGKAAAQGGQALDARAPGPGIRVPVRGDQQPTVTAAWLGYDLPARINPAQPAQLKFLSPRKLRVVRGGQGVVVQWAYKPRRPGVQLKKKVELPRNFGSVRRQHIQADPDGKFGEFRLFTHERSSLGMVNYNLTALVSSGGRDQTIYSRPLEINVVDGYTLAGPHAGLTLKPGSRGDWAGSIWRDPEFRRTVKVSAVGLPLGVRCSEAELELDATAYELSCTATADAPEGAYDLEIRAASVLSDEGTTPYLAEPVPTTLTIQR